MMKMTTKKLEAAMNAALYAAAEKAGMRDELASCQAEIVLDEYNGTRTAYIAWEAELRERPEFVFPAAAFERAEKWLAIAAPKHGFIAR